ncbi:MAG TPA: hemolysin III family protein [Mycobacteriales bacterium]|nr:hemolysin III family protein [Mycobacteriales bacterium]
MAAPTTAAESPVPVKPRLRGVLHQGAFDASLVSGTFLVVSARGALATVAAGVYAVSLSALFGSSALYHRLAWSGPARRRMQRLDYAMIFVLIAGTYTPLLLLAGRGRTRALLVAGVWLYAAVGTGVRLAWPHAPQLFVGALYLGLGWLGVAVIPVLWPRMGAAAGLLVVVGGLLYTLGALCLHRRRPDPVPAVFGYHEVFHAFVVAAATCHYAAIAVVVLA